MFYDLFDKIFHRTEGTYSFGYLLKGHIKSFLITYLENPLASLTYKLGITTKKPLEEVELEDMFDPRDLR